MFGYAWAGIHFPLFPERIEDELRDALSQARKKVIALKIINYER